MNGTAAAVAPRVNALSTIALTDAAFAKLGHCLQAMVVGALCLLVTGCKFPYPPDVGGDARDGSLLDAPTDAAIDAATAPFFDVAYPSEWVFSVPGPAVGFVLVVNSGTAPLGLSTFQVQSVSDNHPTAVVRVTAPSAPGAILQSGSAGGALSPLSQTLLVGSGLVPEPWTDRKSQLLALELINAPAGSYDVAIDLHIALEDHDAALPMTIHVVPGPTVYVDPLVARRVRVYR